MLNNSQISIVPELRFSGFTDDEYQFGSLKDFCEVNPSTKSVPEKFIYIDLESVTSGRLEKENVIIREEAPSRAQRVLEFDDILFQTVRPYQRNNYHFSLKGDYVASTGYAQIRASNCPQYFFQLFLTDTFVNKVLRRCTGTSYPAISSSDLENIPIAVAPKIEQQKIASFLTAIDQRIQLLEKKKAKLEEYKKGVMQKLFSQEIRFKDDEGKAFPDWEEKRLGDVFKAKKGTGLSKSDLGPDGMFECILYGELYTTYPEVISDIKSRTSTDGGTLSKKGDLLVPCSTTTTAIDLANITALDRENVRLGGDITILRGGAGISNIFYAYYLSNHKKLDIAKYGQGTTIVHLYYNHFKVLNIDKPCIEEQRKIADFLVSLDLKIKILEEEVAKSILYKKGLLQKMFV